MNKKKKIILLVPLVVLIILGMYGGVKIAENTKEKERIAEEERIMQLYQKANYVVSWPSWLDLESQGQYEALRPVPDTYNAYGIEYYIYLPLKLYEKETGVTLSYETIVNYFSQEYEPDGSLRLYNNGLHPEMEAYIEWAWGRNADVEEYINEIKGIHTDYYFENKDKGFENQVFHKISPQMLDELVKKEADPDYEMDLLSLQQQGY